MKLLNIFSNIVLTLALTLLQYSIVQYCRVLYSTVYLLVHTCPDASSASAHGHATASAPAPAPAPASAAACVQYSTAAQHVGRLARPL